MARVAIFEASAWRVYRYMSVGGNMFSVWALSREHVWMPQYADLYKSRLSVLTRLLLIHPIHLYASGPGIFAVPSVCVCRECPHYLCAAANVWQCFEASACCVSIECVLSRENLSVPQHAA